MGQYLLPNLQAHGHSFLGSLSLSLRSQFFSLEIKECWLPATDTRDTPCLGIPIAIFKKQRTTHERTDGRRTDERKTYVFASVRMSVHIHLSARIYVFPSVYVCVRP